MFSVIIPYYKKRLYIERCIDSVIAQTNQNFEIILIDDGSDDDIATLINRKYVTKVLLITQFNQGVSVARNAGINRASHDYIAFLDADDYWSPLFLEHMTNVISKEEDIKIIGSHYTRKKNVLEIESSKTDYYKFENYFKSAIKNTYFISSGSVIKRTFFDHHSGFNKNLKRGEDLDMWFRTVVSGGNAFFIKNTLIYYSDEDQNQATEKAVNVSESLVGTINSLYQPLFVDVNNKEFEKFISKYVYFNIYTYYFTTTNNLEAKENLEKNKRYYFFAHLIYYIPFRLGRSLIKNPTGRSLIRIYLKFIFRYIHN